MKNSVADPFPCPEKERSRQIHKNSNFRVQQNRPCQKHRIKIDDKTTPRLIQFHTLKNAVNPPFLGGFSIFNTVVA